MPFAALLLAAAVPPPPLVPTGPWIVRAEESMCLLERDYMVGGKPIALAFQPLLDLPDMELYVISADKSDQQYVGAFKIETAPEAQRAAGNYYSLYSPQSKMRITRLSAKRAMLDDLKDGDTLQIVAKPINQRFVVVKPEKAKVALQTCVDELKKSWGVDPSTEARAVSSLEGNPGHYFGPDSYPPEALRAGLYGRVIALLNITTDGTVEHCRIVSSAGKELNDGTCKAAMRIHFKPPRDKDGKPLPSTYLLPVRWTMPGAPG